MKKTHILFIIVPLMIAWLFASPFEYHIVFAQTDDEQEKATKKEGLTQFLNNEAPTSTSGASLFKKGQNEVEFEQTGTTSVQSSNNSATSSSSTSTQPSLEVNDGDSGSDDSQEVVAENENSQSDTVATTTVVGGVDRAQSSSATNNDENALSQGGANGVVILANPYKTYQFDKTTTHILLSLSGLLALVGLSLVRGGTVSTPKIANFLKLPYLPENEIKEKTYGNQ